MKSGKVRYVGASNFSGWHLMKAMETARQSLRAAVSQQIYYSLQARDAESELVPAASTRGLGILVWSPLAGGLLSGKYRRGKAAPEGTRHFHNWGEPPVTDEGKLHDIIDVLVGVRGATAHLAGASRARLVDRASRRHLGHHWREDRCPTHRQPQGGRSHSERARAQPARRGECADAALSLLAPGQHGVRSTLAGGPLAAGTTPSNADRTPPSRPRPLSVRKCLRNALPFRGWTNLSQCIVVTP